MYLIAVVLVEAQLPVTGSDVSVFFRDFPPTTEIGMCVRVFMLFSRCFPMVFRFLPPTTNYFSFSLFFRCLFN